jgi:DNA-binding NarL/FixJ family response regulator
MSLHHSSGSGGVRVLVADDDPDIREALRDMLEVDGDVRVIGEAGDGATAVELAARLRPDVALLDIRMPLMDGLAAAEHLTRLGTAVIMITTFGEAGYVDRAVELGVAGFLLKTGDPAELIAGVRAVAQGGSCLSPQIARHVMRELRSARGGDHTTGELPPVPDRHRQVLDLLAKGHTNAEIARDLHLSEGTVKAYLRELFPLLGVRNRVEAAILMHSLAGRSFPGRPSRDSTE